MLLFFQIWGICALISIGVDLIRGVPSGALVFSAFTSIWVLMFIIALLPWTILAVILKTIRGI